MTDEQLSDKGVNLCEKPGFGEGWGMKSEGLLRTSEITPRTIYHL